MASQNEEFPNPGTDYLNEFVDDLGERSAQQLRKDVISLAYKAFTVFLNSDRIVLKETSPDLDLDADDSTAERTPTRILQIDMLASPALVKEELEDVLMYELVRTNPRAPGTTFGADRIYMMLPVPEDFSIDQLDTQLPELNNGTTVFVKFEKDTIDGVHVRRFAISHDRVFEYVALGDPDHESEASDIFDRDLHYTLTGEQKLGALMLAQLIEDHKNFKVKPLIAK